MKHLWYPLLVSVLSVVLITSCGRNSSPSQSGTAAVSVSDTTDTAAVRRIIHEKTTRFTQAHISGDTAYLNSIFTADARILAPNYGVATGHAAISGLNQLWVSYGIKEFKEESAAFYGSGIYFIDEGTYSMRYGKDNQLDMGKYLNVWKKENGDWKIYSNIWNSSLPVTQ